MRWFFGLSGITCFNCGEENHHGSQCNRPVVEECARNGELVLDEIDRAGALSFSKEVESNRKRKSYGNDGENDRGRKQSKQGGNNRSRAKSQPAKKYNFETQTSTYGKIKKP